jgi:hypothetical protein
MTFLVYYEQTRLIWSELQDTVAVSRVARTNKITDFRLRSMFSPGSSVRASNI